jgi:hypothetical protein
MDRLEVQAETLEERLIYWTIVSTWGFWLLGALYVVGPVLGYVLLGIVLARELGLMEKPHQETRHISPTVILWVAGMLIMEVALIIAFLDFELGFAAMVKSSIGWMKGWALLAIFILAGAMLSIRPEIVYRASSNLAAQTLLLAPLLLLASLIGLPQELYVSPLQILGGPGPEFFDVTLYTTTDTSGLVRWRFFAPWATAAAFLAGFWFIFAMYETDKRLKVVALVSAVVVCLMTGSRSSVIVLPATVVLVLLISNVRRPEVLIGAALAAAAAVLLTDTIIMFYEDLSDAFYNARAASSRVRATLVSIASHRWQSDAFWFGHGTMERGPHLVEFMMIGSHHTWYGLLFVKGIVGFIALAIPLTVSLISLSLKAQVDRVARAGLGVLLATTLFSFGDNLEIIAYFIWPGLIIVGIAHGRPLRNPFAIPGPERLVPA